MVAADRYQTATTTFRAPKPLKNQAFFAPPTPRFRQIATKPLPAASASPCAAGFFRVAKGMRYALFVQGFDQLKEKYSDNIANTIKGNCQVWAYLQSDDPETLREMSDKLGSYTTSSYQLSASNGKYTTPSNSQSVSLTERKLLNTDEVRRVKRPHQIITSRDHPAMMYAPDLSQWMFNKMLGLGDMEHNRRLREEREQKRPIITDTKQEIALWNIWIYYQKDIMRRLSQQKGAMGGGLDDD